MDEFTLEITKERILEAFRKCHSLELSFASVGIDTTIEENLEILEQIASDDLFQIRLKQLKANFKIDLYSKFRSLMDDKSKSIQLSATSALAKLYLQDEFNKAAGGGDAGAIPNPGAEHIPKKISIISVASGKDHPTKPGAEGTEEVADRLTGEVDEFSATSKQPDEDQPVTTDSLL